MRLRRLVADSLKRLVQLLHFVRSQCLSPENWCLCVENGVLPGFWGHFGVFLAILGRKTGTFSYFFPVTSLLREAVEVLGVTPHLLNVTAHLRLARPRVNRNGAADCSPKILHLLAIFCIEAARAIVWFLQYRIPLVSQFEKSQSPKAVSLMTRQR